MTNLINEDRIIDRKNLGDDKMTEKHEEDKSEKPKQHHEVKTTGKNELNFWRITTVILALLFVISLYTNGFSFGAAEQTIPTASQPSAVESNEESSAEKVVGSVTEILAKCLTENGVTMYGAEWCGHCQNQKKLFGDSFQYINWVDCDKERAKCQEAGIRGYPTWVINGNAYPGEQTFERLASLSGCQI